MNSQALTRGLAFFSVGLGLTELLAPRTVARAIGIDEENELLLRSLGVRELGAGVGIMQGNPGTFLWTRVGGDIMDLGLLAAALRSRRTERNRLFSAMAVVAGITALDVAASLVASRNPAQPDWRVAREDRAGIERDEPVVMRRHADRVMQAHASGHLHGHNGGTHSGASDANLAGMSPEGMREHEDETTGEFEAGD